MIALGALAGIAATALAARWSLRRSLQRVRAAEQRARSAERLAELGSMTGGLAHEIKNPLSTIGLNAQLLAEGINDLSIPSEEKERLNRRNSALRREVERLRTILTDFLEYAGELRLDPRPADVNPLLDELADFFSPQAEKQGVRLRVDLAPGPLTANIDAAQMKQAVLNLMLNAVQAMGAPDPANAKPRELILRTSQLLEPDKSRSVRIHVIDTGPGIDPDTQDKIFRPYFTTKSGGTGLGLPTTRRIIDAHHGRISVNSTVGQGTEFVLTLPAIESP